MPAKKRLVKGNEALALGAIAGGCDCFFGYPITPQNEVPEMLSSEMPKNGRWICEECFTTCNRAIEHCHIYNKLHPFKKVSLSE